MSRKKGWNRDKRKEIHSVFWKSITCNHQCLKKNLWNESVMFLLSTYKYVWRSLSFCQEGCYEQLHLTFCFADFIFVTGHVLKVIPPQGVNVLLSRAIIALHYAPLSGIYNYASPPTASLIWSQFRKPLLKSDILYWHRTAATTGTKHNKTTSNINNSNNNNNIYGTTPTLRSWQLLSW
jgi:hypothetical protein